MEQLNKTLTYKVERLGFEGQDKGLGYLDESYNNNPKIVRITWMNA